MPLQLPANPLLLRCANPLDLSGNESSDGLFRYAAGTVKALLKEELAVCEKLKLSLYDFILSGIHTVAELTRKKYPHAPEQQCVRLMPCLFLHLLIQGKPLFICGIDPVTHALSSPRQIRVELTGSTAGFENVIAALQKSSRPRSPFPFGQKRRAEELRLKISVGLMQSAADDLRFISRFNEETFFRGLPENSFASPLLDLSEKAVRNGFAALYAITFFGLTDSDLFTVSGVFGFTDTGVRSKDDKRQKAAAELAGKIGRSDRYELAEMADKMGARLLELALPPADADDPMALAGSCTLYAGLAQLGKAYLTALSTLEIAIVPDAPGASYSAAKERARLMSRYDNVLLLCQGILTMLTAKKPQLSSLNGYRQTRQLSQELAAMQKDTENEQ